MYNCMYNTLYIVGFDKFDDCPAVDKRTKKVCLQIRTSTIHKWVARLVTDDFIGSSVSFQALLHKRCSIPRNVELSVQEEGA